MTCTCPDCIGFDPLNPAEEDRAAERRLYLVPEEEKSEVCGHKPPCGCS